MRTITRLIAAAGFGVLLAASVAMPAGAIVMPTLSVPEHKSDIIQVHDHGHGPGIHVDGSPRSRIRLHADLVAGRAQNLRDALGDKSAATHGDPHVGHARTITRLSAAGDSR